jgi:hypothetical protein
MGRKLFGEIESPCTYGWENMRGDERVRFCEQCRLNVHNLAEMTDEDALALLEKTKAGRTCVRMYKRADGSVYTDNCPYKLRTVRNLVRRVAPWAMLFLAVLFRQSAADAQGLVGAPITAGRFGQVGADVRIVPTEGERNWAYFWTAYSAVVTGIIGSLSIAGFRRRAFRLSRLGVCALATTPAIRRARWWFAIAFVVVPAVLYFVIMYGFEQFWWFSFDI